MAYFSSVTTAHHVFSAAFFSLSDIRKGASLFVLNLPRPSAAVSTFFFTIWTTSSSSRLCESPHLQTGASNATAELQIGFVLKSLHH